MCAYRLVDGVQKSSALAAPPMVRLLSESKGSGKAEALTLAVSWVETAAKLEREVYDVFLKYLSDACLRVLSVEVVRHKGLAPSGVAGLLLHCWGQLPALVRACHHLSDASDLEMESAYPLPTHVREEIPFVFLLLLWQSSEREIAHFLGLEFLSDWTKALLSAYCAFLDLGSRPNRALPRQADNTPGHTLSLLTADLEGSGRLADLVCAYVSEAAQIGGIELLLTDRVREGYADRLHGRCSHLARLLHAERRPEASGVDIDLTSD